MTKDKNIIYRSKIRYHTPNYPYRIVVERIGKRINISHYSLTKDCKGITYALGINGA